jgi:hypothetical protein
VQKTFLQMMQDANALRLLQKCATVLLTVVMEHFMIFIFAPIFALIYLRRLQFSNNPYNEIATQKICVALGGVGYKNVPRWTVYVFDIHDKSVTEFLPQCFLHQNIRVLSSLIEIPRFDPEAIDTS